MKYTLRQLHIFLAVAKHGSISKAAAALHMSQSAASESLLKLEHTYQVTLFDRKSNRLILTSIGQTVRKEAESLLAQCNSFEQTLNGHRGIGHLKVGASYTIGNHLVTRYLSGYLSKYPKADVQLEVGNTPDIATQVLNYEVDIGMIEGAVQHKDLELIPWRQDKLLVFCSASHPLAKKQTLTTQDIKQATWILREPESGARNTFDQALADLLPSINIFLELKHNEAIKNAVESGLGIGCLSKIVLQKNLDNGELVPLTLPKRNMTRTFYFALPKQRFDIESVEAWMQTCTEEV